MIDEDRDLINESVSRLKSDLDSVAAIPTDRLTLICAAFERSSITGLNARVFKDELKKRSA